MHFTRSESLWKAYWWAPLKCLARGSSSFHLHWGVSWGRIWVAHLQLGLIPPHVQQMLLLGPSRVCSGGRPPGAGRSGDGIPKPDSQLWSGC